MTTIQQKTLAKNAFVNMLGDILIEYKHLNEENIKDLQNVLFIIIDFTDDQINEMYERGVCKKVQEFFPNSEFDFVEDEGLYVIPRK